MKRVRIFKPSASAMQSGQAKTDQWVLEFDKIAQREPEDLMGWTASGDTLNQVQMRFDSKEEAIAFADQKGWDYIALKSRDKKIKPRNYMDNYKYRPFEDQV